MGIPHLLRHLDPYGEHVGFERSNATVHANVVIDGAAFAYHAYHVALAQRAGLAEHALEAIPSYKELGRVAILWLGALQDHGLHIAAIYFDGALPTTKFATRTKRLQQVLKELSTFHALHHNGIPQCRVLHAPVPEQADIFSPRHVPARLHELPAAPFLVSAVMEAILESDFCNVTHLVPGEADDYCAHYAQQHPNTSVATNDSDLFIHELGEGGQVMLLKSFCMSEDVLKCKLWRPRAICKRLQVSSLVKFAYSVQQGKAKTVSDHALNANKISDADPEFQLFSACYASDFALTESLSLVPIIFRHTWPDARLSEYLLGDAIDGKRTMWLGTLLEDPERVTAWKVSRDIRTLAYSISDLNGLFTTIEVIRQGPYRLVEQAVNHLSKTNLTDAIGQVLLELEEWRQQIKSNSQVDFWVSFCIQRILRNISAAGSELPFLVDVLDILSGQWTFGSWAKTHFAAQLQGELYSWRLLKQAVSVHVGARSGEATGNPGQQHVAQLSYQLDTMPSLGMLFDYRSQAAMIEERTQELRSVANTIFSTAGIKPREAMPPSEKSRKSKKKGKRESETHGEAKSNNIFDILLQDGD